MIRDIYEVPDVEHSGEIDHFTHLIIDAGGTILKVVWNDEDDDDTAYIVYQCQNKKHQKQILDKLENE